MYSIVIFVGEKKKDEKKIANFDSTELGIPIELSRFIKWFEIFGICHSYYKLLNILTREDDHRTIQRRRVRWRGCDGLSEDGVAFSLRHDDHLKRTYSRSSFS